jgi:hypothetical protein
MEVPMHPCFRAATALLAALPLASPASAATPQDLLRDYESAVRAAQPGFAGFSAARGAEFFRTTHGAEWSCASCHTERPAVTGRHARTGKSIAPLAPAANPERFTDPVTVEKWFRRNCGDVLGRPCTAQEKGDVLAYLRTIERDAR